jgi:hypothetical protein
VWRRAELPLRSQTQAGDRAVFEEPMIKTEHKKALKEVEKPTPKDNEKLV